jgi:multiple sugar transport system permease protein
MDDVMVQAESDVVEGSWWSRWQRSSVLIYLLSVPALLLTIGIIVPFLMSVYFSLTNMRLVSPTYRFVGLKNYLDLFGSGEFWSILLVTVIYAVVAVALEIVLGIAIAWVLNHSFPGVGTLRVLLILPLMIPPVIGALQWKMMLNPSMGVYTYLLSLVGLQGFGGFTSAVTALPMVILVDIWLFTPFVALIVLAGLQAVPKEPIEAAKVDAAGEWFIFTRLTLPMLRPYIFLAGMFRLIDAFKMFDIIYATTKGGPGSATTTLTIQTYFEAFRWYGVGKAMAYMIILWLIVFILSQFMVPVWRRSLD